MLNARSNGGCAASLNRANAVIDTSCSTVALNASAAGASHPAVSSRRRSSSWSRRPPEVCIAAKPGSGSEPLRTLGLLAGAGRDQLDHGGPDILRSGEPEELVNPVGIHVGNQCALSLVEV